MKTLFRKITEGMDAGMALVLVTVLDKQGSAPQGAGARMLVSEKGREAGTIGGGQAEYEAVCRAAELLQEKKSDFQWYLVGEGRQDQTVPEDSGFGPLDTGMLCGGALLLGFQYIAPERLKFRTLCAELSENPARGSGCCLTLEFDGIGGWEMDCRKASGTERQITCIRQDGRLLYREPFAPEGRVILFGGGHVAQELVPLLAHLGFSCTVFDDREEFLTEQVFPEASQRILGDFTKIDHFLSVTENDYLCIMTRGHQWDYLVQRFALSTPVCYIGVIGSRAKHAAIRQKLLEDGYSRVELSRFCAPIGVSIGAKTPAEIAVSIAAQLIEVRAGR